MSERNHIIEYLLRFLFPPKCIFCGSLLPVDVKEEICSSCHKEAPYMPDVFLSPEGEAAQHGCEKVICLFSYEGMVKELLTRYKFKDRPSYFRTLSSLLCEKIIRMTKSGGFDIIISVPLSYERELSRGYNQSRLISGRLAGELGKPELSRALKRVRHTEMQSRLSKTERKRNIRGAFEVVRPSKIAGKKILIIDDIITTGSTLGECGRVLTEAGAAGVLGAVIASGRTV